MEDHVKLEHVPTGLKHIGFAAAVNKQNRNLSEPLLREFKPELEVLGTSLAAIYESATCHRKCLGGDHLIETIASRVYNLISGAYALISVGLYDEAQSLIRSVGEIANILSLSMFDREQFVKWARSTKEIRIREFSPAKVRKALESSGVVLMDKDWYSTLCESFTHITPEASINRYDIDRNICGGIVQKKGLEVSIKQLSHIAAAVALYFCAHSELDDYFGELKEKWLGLNENES